MTDSLKVINKARMSIALCPTKPNDSIPTLEKVLYDNKVELPKR